MTAPLPQPFIDPPPERIPALAAGFLQQHGLRLVTAESCTAGLIASLVAEVPGAGSLLDCAFVTYSLQAKLRCLGVSRATIERCNLTSPEVATEMALGALRCSQANLAIANTGVADDVDPTVPAGTQCFAWAFVRAGRREPVVVAEARRFEGNATPSAMPRRGMRWGGWPRSGKRPRPSAEAAPLQRCASPSPMNEPMANTGGLLPPEGLVLTSMLHMPTRSPRRTSPMASTAV